MRDNSYIQPRSGDRSLQVHLQPECQVRSIVHVHIGEIDEVKPWIRVIHVLLLQMPKHTPSAECDPWGDGGCNVNGTMI